MFGDVYAAFEQGQMDKICYEASQAKGYVGPPLRVSLL